MKRRQLLKSMALGAGIAPIAHLSHSFSSNQQRESNIKICIFSKHLQFLDYQGMAETSAEIGFGGVDISVRPGGHVLPENVARDLPKAVKAVQDAGLSVPMITTAIRAADEEHTESILQVAADLGIKYYRMAYYSYDDKIGVSASLDSYKQQIKKLAKLNKKYQIHGAYQNHAGNRIGGPVWDIYELIKNLDPAWVGCQYDIRHATVEGGQSWPRGLDLLKKHIKTIVFKDFHWAKNEQGKWYIKNVPMGEGMVDFPKYLKQLKSYNFSGPASMHVEYKFHKKDEPIAQMRQKAITVMKKDLQVVRDLLQTAGI